MALKPCFYWLYTEVSKLNIKDTGGGGSPAVFFMLEKVKTMTYKK